MKQVYIASAKRSPVANLLGYLSTLTCIDFACQVIKELLKQTGIEPTIVDQVIIGQVLTAGLGQNPARQTAIASGLAVHTPAYLVNQVCGSSLQSVMLGASAIALNQSDIVIAGGQESMSNALHCAYLRKGIKFGDLNFIDTMMHDGLTDAFSKNAMGVTAENIAQKFGISRLAQDEYAYYSQQKSTNAQKNGIFIDEIVPIHIHKPKVSTIFSQDEFIKPDTTIADLGKLRPVFAKDGSVTAGNSSGINDGAAFLVLASELQVSKHKMAPMARIVSFAQAGVEPDLMGTGPIPASRLALKKAGWSVADLDLIECNEAFAAQSICVINELGLDPAKVNVNGGAIAIGHPIGASGARVLTTLLHEMKRRKAKQGLATLCVGGGMGVAMCLELV